MTTVAALVADLLAQAGVRRCYTVPGESFLALIDALAHRPGMELVSVRHESGASFMADADARLTGVPAVAMASRGPGASNLAIGVHTAYQDSIPMIILLGQVDSGLLGKESFQEVDLTAFYSPISKWTVTAERAEDVPTLVARGLEIATSGRPGPVAIALPSDFVDVDLPVVAEAPAPPTVDRCQIDMAAIEDLATQLWTAKRPIAIVGEGARSSHEAMIAVAERFGVGVCTSFRRQDAFPVDHPAFLGHLGLAAPPGTVAALASADLVLVVGTRLDEVTTQIYTVPSPDSTVVHIGRYRPDQIDANPAAVLAALATVSTVEIMHAQDSAAQWADVHAEYMEWSTPAMPRVPESYGPGVHPVEVILALHRCLPANAVVTNDAGNFAGFLHRYWRFPPTTAQLAPANGAMGYAVPAAVAAGLAAPDRPVVAVVGDGGALMTGQEIETAVRTGSAIVVVILQNGLYGTIAMHQAIDTGRMAGIDIGGVDFVRWAEGLGAVAYSVTDAAELDGTLTRALNGRRPAVVAVRTDPQVISTTARLDDLISAKQSG
jgi:acetolactate synthase-1/2/3 large subunit